MLAPERLAPDFRNVPGVLIYSGSIVGDATAFRNSVAAAVGNRRVLSALAEAFGQAYQPPLAVPALRIEDMLQNPRALGRAVRTLCDAPVAVFDGSEETPDLMFLLGVRAVVRRGVTVVVHVGKMDAAAWQKVPFNLRELRLVAISDRGNVQDAEPAIREALAEGLKQYTRRPSHYADLPAFEPLRKLGGHKDDYIPRTPQAEVLVLCTFDDSYSEKCWPELQRAIRNHWTPDDEGVGPARRVVDLQSPELVGRRLYEAIRRDAECVVDLTLDRPNVYFELGVRMVANDSGARVVRCRDLVPRPGEEAPGIQQDSGRIDRLLGTRSYLISSDEPEQGVAHALIPDTEWPGGSVSREYVYMLAQTSVYLRQEAGGRNVETLLWSLMEEAIGQDRNQNMVFPVLYAAQSRAVSLQVRRFAFDALLAYIVFTGLLPDERRDGNKRAIALQQVEIMLEDLDLEPPEKDRLKALIAGWKQP